MASSPLWLAAVAACLLAACGSAPVQPGAADTTSQACVGSVPAVAGLRDHPDAQLMALANGLPGKGGLCGGRSFAAATTLTVYRLWDSGRPFSEFGVWWALVPPTGSREAYRQKYAICPSWPNRLDRLVTCTVQPGSVMVLGPGQSVDCDAPDPQLPQSATVQVYTPPVSTRFVSCTSTQWP